MLILLLDLLPDNVLAQLRAGNVFYRPDLLEQPAELTETLTAAPVDAIVTRADIASAIIDAWTATRTPTYLVHVVVEQDVAARNEGADVPRRGLSRFTAHGADDAAAYVAAFELLEQEAMRHLPLFGDAGERDRSRHAVETVALIGAGLVNLVTATTLQKAGYAVRIIDADPDPRDDAPWAAYGCSRGGGDARMFSLSEMNNFHDKQSLRTMNQQFRRSVQDRGWVVYREGTLQAHEWRWIEDFERVPVWLAQRYTEDIFGFNRESHFLWSDWLENEPELFTASGYLDGIVRLFDSPATFESKTAVQQRLGAVRRVLSAAQIAEEHPSLAEAVTNGYIAGGVDEVGFTVMAHAFMRQLVDRLEERGAEFCWNTTARGVVCNPGGPVDRIECDTGQIEAHHYVVSPGAYGRALLECSRSRNQIHGVLGVWLTLPNSEPRLTHSLKLRRTGHIVEAANITIAHDDSDAPLLILGSGYGYTGVDPANIDPRLLDALYRGLVDTAANYFRHSYELAIASGDLSETFRYCVRPWTSTGLGIFEQLATRTGGKYVVTGGHNTGGFAQAPAVAQAVLAAVQGRRHAMHHLYHPDRMSIFLGHV